MLFSMFITFWRKDNYHDLFPYGLIMRNDYISFQPFLKRMNFRVL